MGGPGYVISLLGRGRSGRNGEGVPAFLDGEVLQRVEIVGRHSDHLGTGLLVGADRFAERVSFGRAAGGECLREEIQDDWSFLQLGSEVQLERLAPDGAGGSEIGCL